MQSDLPVTFVPMAAVDEKEGVIATPSVEPLNKVRKGHTQFRNNDVIFARITPCMENGKCAIARNLTNGLGFGSTEFHVLRSNGRVIPEYIFYYLRQKAFRSLAAGHMTSTVGQLRLSATFLAKTNIPVPPLDEQRRIVDKVGNLLAESRVAKLALQKIPGLMKGFRQIILSKTFRGELTKRESSDEPVEELLSRTSLGRYLREPAQGPNAQSLPGLPEKWMWVTLSQLSQQGRPIIYGIIKPGPHVEDGVPYVRINEMESGAIDLMSLRKTSRERAEKFKRATLKGGDILISKDGTIGKVAIVPPELEGGNITQHIVRVAVDNAINRDYIAWAIQSPIPQTWLRSTTKGIALRGVNVQDFRKMPIPLAPIQEQTRIVERINGLTNQATEVEATVTDMLQGADSIEQSVLAKAFRGQLET